jgi:predicted dehydrogenase
MDICVGFIGAGSVAPLHLEGLRRLTDVRVTALAVSGEDRAIKRATELHIPKAYPNYQSLLEDPDIDVVHIMLPNASQGKAIQAALEAGKHVVAEKPLALTVAEAHRLVALARSSGLLAAANFHYRYYNCVQQVRQMAERDEFGKILFVSGGYHQDWRLFTPDLGWRADPELCGPSRALADIGSHYFDLIQYLLNCPIKRILAQGRGVSTAGADEIISMLYELDDGTLGSASISQCSAGRKNRLEFEINGSHSSVYWNLEDPNRLWFGNLDIPNQEVLRTSDNKEYWAGGMRNLMANFYKAVRAYKNGVVHAADFPTYEDGLYTCQVVEAAMRSMATGEWSEVIEPI